MLNQVILRLIEICKEKSIIKENVSLENKDDINDIINVLSEKTSISKSTLKSIFYKKRKTIRIDLVNQMCKDLNVEIKHFFNSELFR